MSDATIPVPLDGLPPGTRALAAPREDGTLPRDRKGRAKVRKVVLAADGTMPAAAHNQAEGGGPWFVDDTDWRWLTAAGSRRWDSVAARLGDKAWEQTVALVASSVLTVDCAVDGVRLGPPSRVRLAGLWAVAADADREGRAEQKAGLRDRAARLAEQTAETDGGLAGALAGARGHGPYLPVLVAAAEDLLAGVIHDGPRAFSQAHFNDTKARDDAPAILAAAGASPRSLAALGLTRSPYLGLGGAVAVATADRAVVDLRGFAGPVRFRVGPDPDAFTARLLPDDGTVTLAIVENLQAAETACDAHGHTLAVAWCAGQPADRPLDVIAALAAQAGRVLIAPDADWGGVRIAARIADALPDGTQFEVLDAGTAPHEPREPFSRTLRENLGFMELSAPNHRIREFAAAVRARGYPVEQEASARAVLAAALR